MIELIEIIDPQVLKVTFALEKVIADHQQSVTNGYDGSLAPSMSSNSLEVGSEVTVLAA